MNFKQSSKRIRLILRIILVLISFTLTSCLRTYYPAVYETNQHPIIFNEQDSTENSDNFLSTTVNASKGGYENESVTTLSASYISAYTNDYTNLNTRIYAYTGFYKVSGVENFNGTENYNGTKSVFGLGSELSAAANFKFSKVKFGAGISVGIASEFGGYYNFRVNATNKNLIAGEKKFLFATLSLFPVISIQTSENSNLSIQTNIGIPGYFSPSITYQHKDMIYWLSYIPGSRENDNSFGHRFTFGFLINVNKLWE